MSADRAAARISLGAIRHNVATLLRAAGGARLMAVVKADGYGHGAVPAARAALEGGATITSSNTPAISGCTAAGAPTTASPAPARRVARRRPCNR